MAKLKPWFHVVTPREDLREGKPLDASEFAVHLDHVRQGRAPADYREPERFFERTFLTKSLKELAAGVVRRLSGINVETSAVYNLTTQFGGGKTHALTLLYHLARGGPASAKWKAVPSILDAAGVKAMPEAAVAVFVGSEFDAISGRGGDDGTPIRHTPWGEIAFQLCGPEGLAAVAGHEEQQTAPGGDVIRKFLPKDRPALILMDELLNFIGRNRKSGLTTQLYEFLQNLSEEARAPGNRIVLAVSLPTLMDEMTPEDEADFDRFQKLLDRLGKAMIMSAESETSEIIRRRLFEWGGLPEDARKTATEYADWVVAHRAQLPTWFPVDTAREAFAATYPFHPTLLSVFERKWQALPRFQQTRGILRLLALWVSSAYRAGFQGAHKDPLIGLGTAPLDDPLFRSAAFEQLGGAKLEGAVTTDICGKKDSHAIRLDKEAVEGIAKARLHQKAATTIFFESNGGQARAEATVPEIRLAVAEPDLDIGNVETALEALTSTCYFLSADKNRYRFSLLPNLNKLLSDRRATIPPAKVEERVREEVATVFAAGKGVERVLFPKKSNEITDRPVLALVILPPEQGIGEKGTKAFVDAATREHGTSSRTFKSGLIWVVPEGPDALRDEARKVLAWEDIEDEQQDLRLDESQRRQLAESLKKAQRDLKETVWRTYKNVMLLGKNNEWKTVDLGLVHSSAAGSLTGLILERLGQQGDVEPSGVSPNFLMRNWPPAFQEWSTKALRDAFFASPAFPRLLNPESVKDTISRGVEASLFAYVGRKVEGRYQPFRWQTSISPQDIEISDDMFLIKAEEAKRHVEPPKLSRVDIKPAQTRVKPGDKLAFGVQCFDQHGRGYPCPSAAWSASGGRIDQKGLYVAESTLGYYTVTAGVGNLEARAEIEVVTAGATPPSPQPTAAAGIRWRGEVPPQKWMNFYTKVLSRFVGAKGLKLEVKFEVPSGDAVTKAKIDEAKTALRELGLSEDVKTD